MKIKTPIDPKEQRLTTTQVALRLRVTPRTIKEKCAAGIIRATKPGRDWLIPESSVVAYENRGQN